MRSQVYSTNYIKFKSLLLWHFTTIAGFIFQQHSVRIRIATPRQVLILVYVDSIAFDRLLTLLIVGRGFLPVPFDLHPSK